MNSFETLPAFLAHLLLGVGLLTGGLAIHMRITPHDELALIRSGNTAAAIAWGGTMLGMALPIGAAIGYSGGLLDAVVWGVIALLAQLGAFWGATRLMMRGRSLVIDDRHELASAIVQAAIAIAVGLLNAGTLRA